MLSSLRDHFLARWVGRCRAARRLQQDQIGGKPKNVFCVGDDPVNRVTTCIPWAIVKGTGLLQDEVPHQFDIHGVLEDQGHVMTRLREEVSTRMPRPGEIRSLRLRPGVPVWMCGTPAPIRAASRTS